MDPHTYTSRRRRTTGAEQAADTPLFAPPEPPTSSTAPRPMAGVATPSRDAGYFAPHNGTATSRAAAERMERTSSRASSDRVRIYAFVRSRGLEGATRKEIAQALGIAENTVNPRVRELVVAGMLKPWGEREGCEVLVATEPR